VGGVVRDALIDGSARRARADGRDLDVVVEGDAIAVARRVAGALGGTLTVHPSFGTASIEGLRPGRLGLVTARAERYAAPGALPTVRAGTILDDLARRDFGVNAMAVELASGALRLLDPLGGRQDMLRRRLRVLHPLSFVEDPTRIFRAARYAARLGFSLERATLRAQALALRLAPYPALSGARVAAEIERVLDDAPPAVALARLGAAGAFRLLDPRLRFSRVTRARLGGLPGALDWLRRRGLATPPLELAALAPPGFGAPCAARSSSRSACRGGRRSGSCSAGFGTRGSTTGRALERTRRRWCGSGPRSGRTRPRERTVDVATKYIFVTGGVVSSLGKGLAAASIGALLEAHGYRVTLQKMDAYINIDAGTMSPYQHGEVFVTDDGGATDLDLGHYERFTLSRVTRDHNVTTGKVYYSIIQKERRGDYLGRTVQVIPHITDEIKASIRKVSRDTDVVIVEVGGTVGDIEGLPFLEAVR